MRTLACDHVAHAGRSRLCPHLRGAPENAETPHVRLLTGTGLDHDMCCTACDETLQAGGVIDLAVVCEGCVSRVEEEAGYGGLIGWRGRPGIAERPEPCDPTVTETRLPDVLRHAVDLAPLRADDRRPAWLVLTADATIARFDAGSGQCAVLTHVRLPAEPDNKPFRHHELRLRLHASQDGGFAAVVGDYGRHGAVVDLRTGEVTLALDGGGYHPETVPFSLAFAEHEGRTVVVHRTDWHRLDISDAATGRLLSERGGAEPRGADRRPEHYLDYFHGALYPSPGGRRLADDGWVWHPVGIPAVWDLRRWLGDNVWESEDGPSLRHLCQRDYHWDVPMCWISEDLLAVSGLGTDDEAMLDGVRVFDAETGDEVFTFAGPRGPLFADDRRLYAAAPGALEIWDPYTGERTATVAGFSPTHHHPGAGELTALHDGTLLRWSTGRTTNPPRTSDHQN